MLPSQQAQVLNAGEIVGGCRVIKLLERGGMGEVYLAEHLGLRRHVALKTLRPDLKGEHKVERFFKEAELCARIEHPNVVTIYDVGRTGGVYYLSMQFVDGRNLKQLIELQGCPIPWLSALKLVRMAAKGLEAIHRQKLIHRDIKPSNIMLSADSRVQLMDFGLVREEIRSELTSSGELVGTPPYMSPEQIIGSALDPRTDIYSLGATLYYLLTARHPFDGTKTEIVAQIASGKRPRPVRSVNPAVPKAVENLVSKAMAFRADDRFGTAQIFSDELVRVYRSGEKAAEHDTGPIGGDITETIPPDELLPEIQEIELIPIETTWDILRRRSAWLFAAAVVLVVAAAGILSFGRTGAENPPDENSAAAANLPSTDGMVHIEAGTVQLGNDAAEVEAVVKQHNDNPLELARILENIGHEPTVKDVHVPAFWIDKYEVTNAEYAEFLNATNRPPPKATNQLPRKQWNGRNPPIGEEDHPVVNITYDDAEAYAEWKGKMLPSRVQWLRAFRGSHDWLFPWGDTYDATRANVRDNQLITRINTVPVTATPNDVSAAGVFNLVGNVSEFVRGTFSYKGRTCRMSKGGEFKMFGYTFGIGSSQYFYAFDVVDAGLGFRCVVEEP